MRRGTTPTHIFTLPFGTDTVDKIRVVYKQDGEVKIVKSEADADITENKISVKLSQEETLSLNSDSKTHIQLRILTSGGDALASKVYIKHTGECLDDEVLE